jgi:glycosyltransferase involved in cell wall biosynthesis
MRAGIAERVLFTGELPRDTLPDAYASADAFVFASRTETQGLVLVEALAARLPIVAVDTPATRDVLGDAAAIVPGDAFALAAALRETLASPPAMRHEIRFNPAARYDRAAVGDRVIALYESLLAERAAISKEAVPVY